jgi:hypothetical protein
MPKKKAARRKANTPTERKPTRKKVSKRKSSPIAKKVSGRKTAGPKRRSGRGNQRDEPLWDLDRDGITSSMLSKFVVCQERFRLSAVEGWTDSKVSVPLEYGSCFHECLENHAAGNPRSTEQVVGDYYRKKIDGKMLDVEERKTMQIICGMVGVVFPQYVDYWKSKDLNKTYIFQEQTFEVMYQLPTGRMIKLRGRWDEGYVDERGMWLQENKTKGNIDEEYLQASLHQDLQTMFYTLALSIHQGYPPYGVLYNVARRPGLRLGAKETVRDFVLRVEKDVEKRPEWYFMRWETVLGKNDLDTWIMRSLNPLLSKVCEWWDSIKHNPFEPWTNKDGQPNLGHMLRPAGVYDAQGNGMRGDYFELLYRGNYFGLHQRELAFPELQED